MQAADSTEDIAKLRRVATPEVVSYFAEELSDNASRGVVNTISDIKLSQGDLAEAWREGDTEYASVAMRYASLDYTAERDSGSSSKATGSRSSVPKSGPSGGRAVAIGCCRRCSRPSRLDINK